MVPPFIFMKRTIFRLLTMCLFCAVNWSLSSCSKNDDKESYEGLNSYEAALVGSYITDDDDYEVLYLTLKSDRTGSYEMKWNSESKTKYNIIWSATRTTFTLTNQTNGKCLVLK